ncbi:unnamed protein product [Rotaria sp. Silwood1]|nr:unnamed protein product [Rotaria sp. Silwood1]
MRIFRASGIGQGTMIPYKQLEFESNMRLVSPFITPIDNQQANVVPKSRSDRRYHNLSICPIPGCQSSFETAEELDVHIAANIHTIAEMERRSSNDVARIQLIEAVRSTTTFMRRQDVKFLDDQENQTINFNGSVSLCRRITLPTPLCRKILLPTYTLCRQNSLKITNI